MTLIEITVVIGALLSLLSVLFVGVSAFKSGSDRSKCLVQTSQIQKAVRARQNMYELRFGDSLTKDDLVGPGRAFPNEPVCNAFGTYLWGTTVPHLGTAYVDCQDPDNSEEYHYPQDTEGW